MLKNNSWKPVAIDGILFSGGAEDLIGIEECTDYEINSVVFSKKVILIFIFLINLLTKTDLICIIATKTDSSYY